MLQPRLAGFVFIVGAALAGPALAKLPPLSDEAKAKAAEAAAKTAWSDKVAAFQLCKAQDRVVVSYDAGLKKAGKDVPAAVTTPPCTDPGPYVSAAAAPASAPASAAPAKPLEAAGAHSPTATATSPPSSKATTAEIAGTAKK